jgi:hypothetical protein
MLQEKLIEILDVLDKNSHPLGYKIKLLVKQLYPDQDID